jgi:CheY-like chemotaxis protein
VGDTRRSRVFDEDERAVLQHLANQTAIGIRLSDERLLREQTIGIEGMDKRCRLVAAAAGEIDLFLGEIDAQARAVSARLPEDAGGDDVRRVAEAAAVAAGLLERLVRFTKLNREPAQLTDLGAVLRRLAERRETARRERGIVWRSFVSEEPLIVAAPAGIPEALLASLVHHTEARLASLGDRVFTMRALRLADIAQVDLSWPKIPQEQSSEDPLDDSRSPGGDVLSLAVCRSLLAVLGGHLMIVSDAEENRRLEMELPLAQPEMLDTSSLPQAQPRSAAPFTALILEPDPAVRQTLMAALAGRGHRAVPASTVEEAVDLTKRAFFPVLFCSAASLGTAWQECYQDTRENVRCFVLLTEAACDELASSFPGGNATILSLPVRPEELARMLEEIETRIAVPER